MNDKKNKWMNVLTKKWMDESNKWTNEWVSKWVHKWPNKQGMDEWWTSEQMNEWVNK